MTSRRPRTSRPSGGAARSSGDRLPGMEPGVPMSHATRRALAEGSRLFDAGAFFAAHEAWEEAWRL